MSRAAAALPVLEADWQHTVIEYAQLHRWRVAHFRPGRTSKGWRTPVAADGAGFLDLTLVRGLQLVFAELKTDTGQLSADQERWLFELGQVAQAIRVEIGLGPADWGPVLVEVWRPEDWPRVQAILGRPA